VSIKCLPPSLSWPLVCKDQCVASISESDQRHCSPSKGVHKHSLYPLNHVPLNTRQASHIAKSWASTNISSLLHDIDQVSSIIDLRRKINCASISEGNQRRHSSLMMCPQIRSVHHVQVEIKNDKHMLHVHPFACQQKRKAEIPQARVLHLSRQPSVASMRECDS